MRIFAVMMLVVAMASVAGCGKRGDPIPPEDVDLTYPRTYPTGA